MEEHFSQGIPEQLPRNPPAPWPEEAGSWSPIPEKGPHLVPPTHPSQPPWIVTPTSPAGLREPSLAAKGNLFAKRGEDCAVPEQRLPSAVPEAPTDTLTPSLRPCVPRGMHEQGCLEARGPPCAAQPTAEPARLHSGRGRLRPFPWKGQARAAAPGHPPPRRPQKAPSGIRRPASLRAPHLAASPGSRAHLPAEGGCSLPCGARPARRSERRLCPPWTAPAPASGCRSPPPPPPSCLPGSPRRGCSAPSCSPEKQ